MASEYHRGEMDIHEQDATYKAFMAMTKWGCLALAALLTLIVIWFCTPLGFFTGLGVAIVLTVLGIVFLRDGGGGH